MSVRLLISDTVWNRLAKLLPGKKGDPGAHGRDNRLFVEAVLWIMRTGAPWRDLPSELGKWPTVFKRFRRWVKRKVWKNLLVNLPSKVTCGVVLVDSTIVRAHQHAAGAPCRDEQALGRSRGGIGTKIHVAVDLNSDLMAVRYTAGQVADITQANDLILNCKNVKHVIADRAYDSDALIKSLALHHIATTIPPRSNRIVQRRWSKKRYRQRNIVERFFARIKQLRRIATRYDKTCASYAGFWYLAAFFIAANKNAVGSVSV